MLTGFYNLPSDLSLLMLAVLRSHLQVRVSHGLFWPAFPEIVFESESKDFSTVFLRWKFQNHWL